MSRVISYDLILRHVPAFFVEAFETPYVSNRNSITTTITIYEHHVLWLNRELLY